MSLNKPKPCHRIQEQTDVELQRQACQDRPRSQELSTENLARHDAVVEQTDLNFVKTLVQQEQAHMVEREAKAKRLQENVDREGALHALRKLYKQDLPTNTSPCERFGTLGLTNEPFYFHAKQCMQAHGIAEGSLEGHELRQMTFGSDNPINAGKRPRAHSSMDVAVSEEQDAEHSTDGDSVFDYPELRQNAEKRFSQRRTGGIRSRVFKAVRIKSKIAAARK